MSSESVGAVGLNDYFSILRRQWVLVVVCLAVGLGGALAFLQLAPREYRATTAVLVTPTASDTANANQRAATINLDTEAQLVTATDTVSRAVKDLGLTASEARDLDQRVDVTVPPNTDILDIAYTGTTPVAAQRGSLAFAQAYLEQRHDSVQAGLAAQDRALQGRIDPVVAQLGQVLTAGATLPVGSPERARNNEQVTALNNQLAQLSIQQNQVRATIVSPGRIVTSPGLPSSPSSPNTMVTLAAGLILGLAAGAGLAAWRHRADDRIRRPEDLLRRTRVPVAAVLPTTLQEGEVALEQGLNANGRGYARLRNLVTTTLADSSRRVVVVAGARHGGGPVAVNLAASLARAGESVFLVCGDVFGNSSQALLGSTPSVGLAEVLAGEVDVDGAAQTVPEIPDMRVIGAGADPHRADALLQSRRVRYLIDELVKSGSYVVIEAPSMSDRPDAQTLGSVAELAVIVVEIGETDAGEVLDACEQFESMSTPVLGAVIARYGKDAEPEQPRRSARSFLDRADAAKESAPATSSPDAAAGEPGSEAVDPAAVEPVGDGQATPAVSGARPVSPGSNRPSR
jgi:Mrp family chromosome partitioning ATPase